jgi:hypothetical protein
LFDFHIRQRYIRQPPTTMGCSPHHTVLFFDLAVARNNSR